MSNVPIKSSNGSLSDPVIVDDSDSDEKATIATSATVVDKGLKRPPPVSMSASSQMLEVRTASKRRWEQRAQGTVDPIAATIAENRKESVAKKQHLADNKQQLGTKCDWQSAAGIAMPIKIFASDLPVPVGPQDSLLIDKHCRSLRELIGLQGPEANQSGIQWIAIFNYLVDFEYLLDTIPELVSIPNSVVFYGHGEPGPLKKMNPEMHLQQLVPSDPPNPKTNPLGFKVPWGVHHTKMFLVGFSDGTLRVIIHTANLLHEDVTLKAQGAYVQDFSLPSATPTAGITRTAPPPSCEFQTDLVAYLRTYNYDQKRSWHGTHARSLCDEIQRYDFSSARVVLIPSTPGRNTLDKPKGYVKLSQAIQKHIQKRSTPMPIICQFSSIGSLNVKWLQEIAKSWDVAHTDCAKEDLRHRLKLVYPTVEEIRLSVEGYNGGGSVPGRRNNTNKEFLRPLYHKWSSLKTTNPLYKPTNVPHIKTFFQLTADGSGMEWFCLTSHNLSKAAWGETINTNEGRRIFTRHWELGVFVAPQLFNKDEIVPAGPTSITDDSKIAIPIPFHFDPSRYGINDHPWAVDGTYSQPDRFGRNCCM